MPIYYDGHSRCNIPHKGFRSHGSPVKTELVTFTLENSDGELVSSWKPGETYTLTTASETGDEVHAFMHASVGVMGTIGSAAEHGFRSRNCQSAWGSLEPSKLHHVKWQAPKDVPTGGMCAVFSAAQAKAADAAYQTSSVRYTLHMLKMSPACLHALAHQAVLAHIVLEHIDH